MDLLLPNILKASDANASRDSVSRITGLSAIGTSTCVPSNSGLSNATSKRPKLAFFRGKICPPQSQKLPKSDFELRYN